MCVCVYIFAFNEASHDFKCSLPQCFAPTFKTAGLTKQQTLADLKKGFTRSLCSCVALEVYTTTTTTTTRHQLCLIRVGAG